MIIPHIQYPLILTEVTSVDYRGHDPTVLDSESYVDTSNGVFGVGGRTTTTRTRQYVPGTPSEGTEEGKNDVRSEECIKEGR